MGFKASAPQMDKFSQDMQKKHDDIGGLIQAAHGIADNVNNPSFQGQAGRAFQSAMEEFLAAASKLNEELNTNAQTVKTIASQFSDSELENYKRIHAADMVEVPQLKM